MATFVSIGRIVIQMLNLIRCPSSLVTFCNLMANISLDTQINQNYQMQKLMTSSDINSLQLPTHPPKPQLQPPSYPASSTSLPALSRCLYLNLILPLQVIPTSSTRSTTHHLHPLNDLVVSLATIHVSSLRNEMNERDGGVKFLFT